MSPVKALCLGEQQRPTRELEHFGTNKNVLDASTRCHGQKWHDGRGRRKVRCLGRSRGEGRHRPINYLRPYSELTPRLLRSRSELWVGCKRKGGACGASAPAVHTSRSHQSGDARNWSINSNVPSRCTPSGAQRNTAYYGAPGHVKTTTDRSGRGTPPGTVG